MLMNRWNYFEDSGGGASNGLLNNLEHAWGFDSDGTDFIGSIDATANNITWDTSDFKTGTACASLNGSSSYLVNGTSQDPGFSNAFTINFRAKPNTDASFQVLYEIRNWNTDLNNAIQIRKDSTNKKYGIVIWDSSGSLMKLYTTSVAMTEGSRKMYTATWDGTNLKLYIDASEDTPTKSTDNSGSLTTDNRKMTRGEDTGGGTTNNYNGRLDQCLLYSAALTADQISTIYNSGSGLDLSEFTT